MLLTKFRTFEKWCFTVVTTGQRAESERTRLGRKGPGQELSLLVLVLLPPPPAPPPAAAAAATTTTTTT